MTFSSMKMITKAVGHGEQQDRGRREDEADDVDVELMSLAPMPSSHGIRPISQPTSSRTVSTAHQDEQRQDDLAGQRHALERPRDRAGWPKRWRPDVQPG